MKRLFSIWLLALVCVFAWGITNAERDSVSREFSIDEAEALKWLNAGAIPSDSVKTLLTKKGIYAKFVDAKIAAKKANKNA